MKAIVTGGGGFLGRYVARALKNDGYEVTILGRREYPELKKEGFAFSKTDICDLVALCNAFVGFDEVHHVASLTGISVQKEPFQKINIDGTKNVIKACRKNSIRKLIYTSSPSVVFDPSKKNHKTLDESAPYPEKFLDHYTQTKAEAEKIVLDANSIELATVSLRPHLIFGPEDTNLIPRLIERAKKGKLFIVGDGKNIVDFTYVENAALAHLLASKKLAPNSEISGKAFFITNGEPMPAWDFVGKLLEGMNLKKPSRKIPLRIAYALGAIFETSYKLLNIKREPLMTRFLATQLANAHCYSIKNAKTFLGYEPKTSIDTGLQLVVESLTASHITN
jgi:nucleoside-diphosphate-sugar epimerase